MTVIPCVGPAYILGDNEYVLENTLIPNLTTNNKNKSIVYHFIHEGATHDEWITSYENMHNIEADLLKNLLLTGDKRKGFVHRLIYHIVFW